jgi:hypothetical protein
MVLVNEAGPIQAYVAPVTAGVLKVIVVPAHTGEEAVTVGVAGVGFTTTVAVPIPEVQPPTVTVTLYVPAMAAVAAGRVGFCVALVNADGPVHAYVAPVTVGVVNEMVEPVHTGVDAVAVGVAGVGLTTTVAVPIPEVHPPTVTVTLYVPAIAAVAAGRVGFCVVLVYADGPVQEYVAPVTVGVVNVIVEPLHTGVDAVTVGVAGVGFTTTVAVPAAEVHPPTVTVTL